MSSDSFTEILQHELQDLIQTTPAQVLQLEQHYELMMRWNQRMNLTSIRTLHEAVTRHYCESLFVAATLSTLTLPAGANLVDVGSGAGFPGIPVAIMHPEFSVMLVESHQRKAVFLREATRQLPSVRVVNSRIENVLHSFDLLLSRAVDVTELLRLIPRLASKLALMLGHADVNALLSLPKWTWQEPIKLPWGDRRFLLIGDFDRS